MTVYEEGWAFPPGSRKCHFFTKDGRSLCGKYGFRNKGADYPPDAEESPDDCAPCRRKADKIYIPQEGPNA